MQIFQELIQTKTSPTFFLLGNKNRKNGRLYGKVYFDYTGRRPYFIKKTCKTYFKMVKKRNGKFVTENRTRIVFKM